MNYPLVQQISYQSPLKYFSHFAEQHGAILFDSAELRKDCGRYSFIGVNPFAVLTSKNGLVTWNTDVVETTNPFAVLREKLTQFSLKYHAHLPPFQGGVAGFFSYDLYQHLESIHLHHVDDMSFPDMALGFYDLVVAFDHDEKKAWIFSSGFSCTEEHREHRAKERMQWLREILQQDAVMPSLSNAMLQDEMIVNHFTAAHYQQAVQKVIDYILDGDIFQACISQRFSAELSSAFSTFELYCRLRALNPAPFASYMQFNGTTIVSASPERFLKLTNQKVEARPIKGTRRRGETLVEDQLLANDLLASEKDHAENVMIVDLLRNDLSRVCVDHSVEVIKLCGLESYASVHHLVSVITGQLTENHAAVDLLCATFPGGSITGAPKVRAMEIIAEIEPTQRGPYCGSIGYIGFNGDMDLSIVIRTYVIKNNRLTFQAGGAIVMDSDPVAEYEETLTKANALRRALIYDFVN